MIAQKVYSVKYENQAGCNNNLKIQLILCIIMILVLEENILCNKNYYKNTRQKKKKNYKLLIFFFLKNKVVKVKFLETKINNKQLF